MTIDDYQGEENDVIILSLVRSNANNKLGFCAIENRIIVALSRARHGMYILGNAEMFRRSDQWYKVLSKLEATDRVADGLNLRCAKHPIEEGTVSTAADFEGQAKHGGCRRACDSLLPHCGHRCPLRCHPFDQEHQEVVCTELCVRPRPAGCDHSCRHACKDCHGSAPEDICPSPCMVSVEVRLPCLHTQTEPCHAVQTPALRQEVVCQTPVLLSFPCGHSCAVPCAMATKHRDTIECNHTETVKAPCGHNVKKICRTLRPCKEKCPKKIEGCGHLCGKRCSEAHTHDKCSQKCADLLYCGHNCANQCGEAHTVLCGSACARICTHGFSCPKPCFERCVPCMSPCSWRCKHKKCTKLCHEPCNREPCDEACNRTLPCGHVCRGLCGEPCPTCVVCKQQGEKCPLSLTLLKELEKVYMLDCGHSFDVEVLDGWMAQSQQSGEHVSIQAKTCPTCRKHIHTSPRYGINVKKQLALIDKVKEEVAKKHRRDSELTEEERRDVDRAMGNGMSAGGRWFACPNSHPYFIGDCGGAMVEATCPECGARIGGGNHDLRTDNQYLPNFAGDGHVQAAWPGMGR